MFEPIAETSSPATLALRSAFRPGPLSRRRVAPLGRLLRLLIAWSERARERHELESLSDHSLRDIGLSRAEVGREIAKPFWQA